MNEITTIQNEGAAVLQVIERLVLTPDVSIEKIEKMLDLQERILNRNAHQAFTADLAAMQIELPLIAKNGKGHNSAKYALLEDINQAIRPALQKYGFAVTFRIAQREKEVSITAVLSHKLGHSDETVITLPLDLSGSKNATQAVGSTVSYGKRYAIGALLNISTGDDNDAATPIVQIQPEKAPDPITDERLTGAIAKIKTGEFTLARLYKNFTLTDAQEARLTKELRNDPLPPNRQNNDQPKV